MVKQNLTKEIRDADSNVAKLQTLTLDAVAPLVHILEEAQRGSLTVKTAVDEDERPPRELKMPAALYGSETWDRPVFSEGLLPLSR